MSSLDFYQFRRPTRQRYEKINRYENTSEQIYWMRKCENEEVRARGILINGELQMGKG